MNKANWHQRQLIVRILIAANLAAMGWMAYQVAEPFLQGSKYSSAAEYAAPQLKLPGYDIKSWAELPVLEDGRVKPMQTAAIDSVRKITGRASFQGQSAVPLFLSWLFYDPQNPGPAGIDWDHYAFILCEDFDLRAEILGLNKDDPQVQEKIHGKYLSPIELYQSKPFQRLVVAVLREQEKDSEHYTQNLSPVQRKASSVHDRLRYYEAITGALESRDLTLTTRSAAKKYLLADPIHYVALDRVKDASWFSIGELRFLTTTIIAPRLDQAANSTELWQNIMQRRVGLQPRLYLSEDVRKALIELQAAIKEGKTEHIIAELNATLRQRAEKSQPVMVEQAVKNEMKRFENVTEAELLELSAKAGQKMTLADLKQRISTTMGEQVSKLQSMKNDKIVTDFKERLRNVGRPYVPEDQRYNQMYMDYLEARFPEMYKQAIASQAFPGEASKTVLSAYDTVGAAYRSGESARFTEATKSFFDTVNKVSNEYTGNNYPGETTTALELLLNRVEPFKWAWISMLLAAILFALSMRLESKTMYSIAFVPMLVSLGFQLFAYYGRVSISGRPPVSNMFETVVFVASMGAVFSLVLEYFYRNTVIILAGACIATLGMILADQLPYGRGFDAKIDPLVPVLRSNYWLIIHVMTIVASYAAGALAWAIGNISLIMYWFNSDRRDLLKTLANLCYSAIKVAVLLLGVGTLLGGIWAAESWGRFWGWDPKETWALIALVVYLIPLHARYIGWVKDFGLAVASVVCFSAIVMSWYGVNFILGAGLHSYGMGDGGPWTIFLLGSINLLWVLLVCNKRAGQEMALAAA